MNLIKLRGCDSDEIFELDIQAARCSMTLRVMIDDLGHDETKQDEVVPITNVDSATLKKVVDWLEHHKNDCHCPNEKDEIEAFVLTSWDEEFRKNLTLDENKLCDVILAANFLDIKDLLIFCARIIAEGIRGKSVDQIRRIYKIKEDLSPKECDQVVKENSWVEESWDYQK